jgi:hypothetical protein
LRGEKRWGKRLGFVSPRVYRFARTVNRAPRHGDRIDLI